MAVSYRTFEIFPTHCRESKRKGRRVYKTLPIYTITYNAIIWQKTIRRLFCISWGILLVCLFFCCHYWIDLVYGSPENCKKNELRYEGRLFQSPLAVAKDFSFLFHFTYSINKPRGGEILQYTMNWRPTFQLLKNNIR